MIKGSGVNYFLNLYGLNDLWDVFYTFESGGTSINSVSGGNSIYSGNVIGDSSSFWSKPGSGLFTGAYIGINNYTGLAVPSFTHVFSFEELGQGKQILYSNINNYSGYEIGITDTKKIYSKTYNGDEPVVIATTFNLSSKNLVTFSYLSNSFEFGYYNFNSKNIETEKYIQTSNNIISNTEAILGSGFNGYMDYYLYFNLLINSNILNNVISGIYNIPTGYEFSTDIVCGEYISGYINSEYFITGITGYNNNIDGSEQDLFPEISNVSGVSGIIESGTVQIPIINTGCTNYTGTSGIKYIVMSGYSDSYQMDKVILFKYIDNNDFLKLRKDNNSYSNFYNKKGNYVTSGFMFSENVFSGNSNIFLNGVAYDNSGIFFSQNIIKNNDYSLKDEIIIDVFSGNKITNIVGDIYTSQYNNQEFFLNGVNLTSGIDFIASGNEIKIINNSGISGILFEFPLVSIEETGCKNLWTGKLQRDTSQLFMNGIRQSNRKDYLEGSIFDMLSGNSFNENENFILYDRNGDFFE